jgi:hypothetical protein
MYRGVEDEIARLVSVLSVVHEQTGPEHVRALLGTLCDLIAAVAQAGGRMPAVVRLVDRELLQRLLPRAINRLTDEAGRLQAFERVMQLLRGLAERAEATERRQLVGRATALVRHMILQWPSTADRSQVLLSALSFLQTALGAPPAAPLPLGQEAGGQVLDLVRSIRHQVSQGERREEVHRLCSQLENQLMAAMALGPPSSREGGLWSSASDAAEQLAEILLGTGPLRDRIMPALRAERQRSQGRLRFSQALRWVVVVLM